MQPTPLEHARFRIIPRDSKKLVIFFSDASTPDHEFHWWKAADRIKASVILVNNGPNEWYQRGIEGLGTSVDDVVDVFQKWAVHLGATKIYTIGTGMGGSGALLYGAKLNANALAFAGEECLNPNSLDKSYTKNFFTEIQDLYPVLLQSKGTLDVYYNETDSKLLSEALELSKIPKSNITTLRCGTTTSAKFLRSIGQLNDVIDNFISNTPKLSFDVEGQAIYIPNFVELINSAFIAKRKNDFNNAINIATECSNIYPESELARLIINNSKVSIQRKNNFKKVISSLEENETNSKDKNAWKANTSGPNHKVIQKKNSKSLLVIFSGTGKRDGKFDFWKISQKLDCNIILLNDHLNGWYQNGAESFGNSIENTTVNLKKWADYLGCDSIYTCGTSMGGYGAILYGCALNADILTFGLDTLLKIKHSRSEKMMPRDIIVHVPDLRPVIASSSSKITCYIGEADALDMIGAAHISSLPQVNAITLRGVDHAGARHLQRVSDLVAILGLFTKGKALPKIKFQRKLGQESKRLYLAYSALMDRDWDEVERLGHLALKISPHSEAALYYLGRAALAKNMNEEAIFYLSTAFACTPHFEEAHLHLIQALRKSGAYDQAISVGETFIANWPQSARGLVYLSDAYWSAGYKTASILSLKKALKIEFKPSWESKLTIRSK